MLERSAPRNSSPTMRADARLAPPRVVARRQRRSTCAAVVPQPEGHVGRASARRSTSAHDVPNSVASVRRNLRRAGTLKNRSRTSTVVPGGCAAGAHRADLAAVDAAARRARRGVRGASCDAAGAPPRRSTAAPRRGSPAWRRPRGPRAWRSCWWRGAAAPAAVRRRRCRCRRRARASAAAPPASTSISMRARAGVERVLDQFLDDGSRPLDHLAGGDLVDEVVGRMRIGMARSLRAAMPPAARCCTARSRAAATGLRAGGAARRAAA